MPTAYELLSQGKHEELWDMCCGYLKLTLEEFMQIQERLLLAQLALFNNSSLGQKITKGKTPKTVDEFREFVPLTTYKNYCPELLEKKDELLPAQPGQWVHSSGRSGEYKFKWVPYSKEFTKELGIISYGIGLIASSRQYGETTQMPLHPRIMYAVAPRPYISGALAAGISEQADTHYIPPLEEAETMAFDERIKEGFSLALDSGFDFFFGLSLVLETVGNRFTESSQSVKIMPLFTKPKSLFRLAKGKLSSKLQKRPMLPKDLWHVRGIIGSGLDSFIYRDKIQQMWGRNPLDIYAGSEGGIYATQTWDYNTMTLIPNLNFFEFIPEDEHIKNLMDSSYQPKTLLLDEVQPGKLYEIVITNFHGGSLVRYRPGDMIRVVSLQNEQSKISTPQILFERRADDIVDFFVVRLTEKAIWQAIEESGIGYIDWMAGKNPGEPVLNLYIELREHENITESDLADIIYQKLMQNNPGKADMLDDSFMDSVGFKVVVHYLTQGTFAAYLARKQAEGADLAHLKPPHLGSSEMLLSIMGHTTKEYITVSSAGSSEVKN